MAEPTQKERIQKMLGALSELEVMMEMQMAGMPIRLPWLENMHGIVRRAISEELEVNEEFKR